MPGGYYNVHGHHVVMRLKDHDINIPINSKHTNIPAIKDYFVSSKDKNSLYHSC